MLILASDDVIIEDNIITGNNTAGIIVTSQDFATDVAGDSESDPNPDRIQIRDNVMYDNGNDPVTDVKALMLTQFSTKGPDILAYKSAADAERDYRRCQRSRIGLSRYMRRLSHPERTHDRTTRARDSSAIWR